jgi:phytoene desaturase
VTVVEQSSHPGGRASAVAAGGFSLDVGPTVFTMPHVLEDAFRAAGASMADHLTVEPVDPIYRVVFADESVLRVRAGRAAMTQEIREFSGPREAGVFNEFCDWVTELYDLQMPHFIDTNYDSVIDALRPWRATLDLVRIGGFRRLDRRVASFFDDERLRRVFSFQSMYAGVAPHRALALYSVITYMDTVAGVHTVCGGLHTAAAALANVVGRAGVAFEYDSTVTRILRDGSGATTGVELESGDRLVADAVVCNADLPIAYRTLLGGLDAPRVARRGRYSPSCVLWSAGVGAAMPDEVAHHNVHFGDDWGRAFDDITRHGRVMRDPSMLVSVPSLGDTSRAPDGCSTIFALEPVPNLDGKVDWVQRGDGITDRLRRRVADSGYPVDDVRVEEVIGPLEWERRGLARGTPFSLAHTWRQTGPFRPSNRDDRVPGLFFTGSSTLPGVGVPMVLISGKLAAERVANYARETSTLRW